MISRRTVLLGSTAVAAMTIIPALPASAASEFVLHTGHINEAIDVLERFGFTFESQFNDPVNTFRLGLHSPRTREELREMIELYAFTYGDADMRARVRYLVEIGERMEHRFPGQTVLQIRWMMRNEPIWRNDCFDLIRTGCPRDLRAVAWFVEI